MKYGYGLFVLLAFLSISVVCSSISHGFWIQDDGAFAIAQALKANEDVAVTSLNLANNFLTKFGQVKLFLFILVPPRMLLFLLPLYIFCIFILVSYLIVQSALTDARDHVYEMSEKEVNVFF